MNYNNISIELNSKEFNEIKEKLKSVNDAMSFLIFLKTEERKTLYKLGAKSIDFVRDCNTIAQNYRQILPANFNVEELSRDTELYAQLSELQILVNTLAEKLNDTTMAVGSEAMRSSLAVYDYVKTASKSEAGLKSVAEQLQQRFKKQTKNKKEEKSAE